MTASFSRLVFIGGLHRSGTSLLHRCLAEHPQITGFRHTGVPEDEGQHLQSVFPTARDVGGPGRFCLNRGGCMDERSLLVSADSREQLLAEWGRYWDASKPVRVEKSPPTLVRTRFLQALFPGAAFLIMIRHPLAVSLATRRWTRQPLDQLLRHWLACHRCFWRDRRHLRRVRVVRYEALAQAPTQTLSGLCQFIGVAPAGASDCNVSPGIDQRYLGQWRAETSAPERLSLVLRYEWALRRFGYSLLGTHGDTQRPIAYHQ